MYRITQFSGEKSKSKLASVGLRKMTFKKERLLAISHCFATSSLLVHYQFSFPGSGGFRDGCFWQTLLFPAMVLKGYSD